MEINEGNDATLSEQEKAASVEMHVDKEVQEVADALYNTEEKSDNNTDEHKSSEGVETPESSESDESDSDSSESSENESKDDVTEKEEKSEESEKEVKYDLKLSEDSTLNEEVLEDVKTFARENNMSPEAAQSLVEWQENTLRNVVNNALEHEERKIEAWRQEVVNDPELGGDNLQQTSEYAKSVVKRFGNDDLIEMMDQTGIGNNKEVVRFLSEIGKAMANDQFESGQTTGPQLQDWEIMYGKQN